MSGPSPTAITVLNLKLKGVGAMTIAIFRGMFFKLMRGVVLRTARPGLLLLQEPLFIKDFFF